MWRSILASLFIVIVCHHVFNVVRTMGFFKTVYNHKPGKCKYVKGIESGSEDIEVLSDGTVLISSGYIPIPFRAPGMPKGGIYTMDFSDPEKGASELNIVGDFNPTDLHPHGFSLYEDKNTGKYFLFVVNHRIGYDTIEIFEFIKATKALKFIRTTSDPLMRSVNDVLGMGPNSFYFTNDAYNVKTTARYLEEMLRFHWGGVIFCDLTGCWQVSEPLLGANGIALSKDRRYVYVSHIIGGDLRIYEREDSDNSFIGRKPVQTFNFGTNLDNIYVAANGDLWLGCHPVLYKSYGYFGASPLEAPGQVLRVRLHGSGRPPYDDVEVEEVFSDDGRAMALVSMAVPRQGELLIGTVVGKLMHCTLESMSET